jgi:general secretion pathway protein B
MSLILDALKKLDREKAARRNGSANIAVEILQTNPPRPAKKMLRYFAALTITAAAAACVTYALIAGFGIMSKSSPPATINPPPARQAASALPSQEPAVNSREDMSKATAKVEANVVGKESATPPVAKKARRDTVAKEQGTVREPAREPAEQAPKASAAPPPAMKLSGIVWQEEPSERRAMINGHIATEGSLVEGVKVVSIHPTRVRFSHNGKSFEITLGQ